MFQMLHDIALDMANYLSEFFLYVYDEFEESRFLYPLDDIMN